MPRPSKRRARKRGRPATGRDPVITVRLTRQLQRALALLVERHGITRSGAIRCLLNAGLDHSYWMVDPKRNVAYEGDTPGLRPLFRSDVVQPRPKRRRRTAPAAVSASTPARVVKSKQKGASAEGSRRSNGARRIKLETNKTEVRNQPGISIKPPKLKLEWKSVSAPHLRSAAQPEKRLKILDLGLREVDNSARKS